MTDTAVVEIALRMMMVTAKVTAPILVTSLAIGLVVSLFQSVTQIQEVTLTFVPKLAGVALVVLIAGRRERARTHDHHHSLRRCRRLPAGARAGQRVGLDRTAVREQDGALACE